MATMVGYPIRYPTSRKKTKSRCVLDASHSDFLSMSDEPEDPLTALVRTARDVTHERYYVRNDNCYHIPNGVMKRLIAALEAFRCRISCKRARWLGPRANSFDLRITHTSVIEKARMFG